MKKLFTAILVAALCPVFAMAQKAVTNVTTGVEYTGLSGALKAAVNGDVLRINENIEISTALNAADKEVTITGTDASTTIIVKENGTKGMPTAFQVYNKNAEGAGSLTLQNLTIDMSTAVSSSNVIQQNIGTLSMSNVTIKGYETNATSNIGAVRVYGSAVKTVLDNVKFENCTYPVGSEYDVINAISSPDFTISGECNYKIRLNNAGTFVTAGEIADGSVTTISCGSHTATIPVVKDCTDTEKFHLEFNGKMLAPTGNDLYAINYAKVLLVNEGENGKESQTFGAIGGGTQQNSIRNNAVMLINEDVNLTSAFSVNDGINVTIKGVSKDVTITRTVDRYVANASNANTSICFENLTITEDATALTDATEFKNALVRVNGENSVVTLRNVTVKDCTNNSSTLITATAGAAWHLDGVTFDNCVVDGNTGYATANATGCAISGKNDNLIIRVNNFSTASQAAPSRATLGAVTIDCAGLEQGETPISIYVANLNSAVNKQTLIRNCSDENLFNLVNKDFTLKNDNAGGLMIFDTTVTGVETVEATDAAEAEYYDLRGCRVEADALTPGMYICRRGATVTKVAVR